MWLTKVTMIWFSVQRHAGSMQAACIFCLSPISAFRINMRRKGRNARHKSLGQCDCGCEERDKRYKGPAEQNMDFRRWIKTWLYAMTFDLYVGSEDFDSWFSHPLEVLTLFLGKRFEPNHNLHINTSVYLSRWCVEVQVLTIKMPPSLFILPVFIWLIIIRFLKTSLVLS